MDVLKVCQHSPRSSGEDGSGSDPPGNRVWQSSRDRWNREFCRSGGFKAIFSRIERIAI